LGIFHTFRIELGGHDDITFLLGPTSSAPKELDFALGPNGNTLLIVGGAGFTSDPSVFINIEGGNGKDVVVLSPPNLANAGVAVRANLGAGDDDMTVQVEDGAPSSARYDVDLGSGDNRFRFRSDFSGFGDDTTVRVQGGSGIDDVGCS